jgi:hypothetical protein
MPILVVEVVPYWHSLINASSLNTVKLLFFFQLYIIASCGLR